MSMNYAQLQSFIQTLLVDQTPSADLTTIFPAAIQDAEQRIYLDMDFLNTRSVWASNAFAAGTRTFTLPTSPSIILTLQGVAAITPATAATPSVGTRNQLEPVSLDMIDSTWPTESVTALPDSWAMLNDAQIVVKPTPDQTYPVELTGTFRPVAMSGANTTTYIGNVYPDLMVAAMMIFLAGYQRNYGAQSDDPKMATSWQAIYDGRLKLATLEEQRRKGAGVGWSPFAPTPVATPPRT